MERHASRAFLPQVQLLVCTMKPTALDLQATAIEKHDLKSETPPASKGKNCSHNAAIVVFICRGSAGRHTCSCIRADGNPCGVCSRPRRGFHLVSATLAVLQKSKERRTGIAGHEMRNERLRCDCGTKTTLLCVLDVDHTQLG